MFNVPMYRNTNNIAFGVSVLIVLESLFTALCRDIESRLSSPYSTGADGDDDEERCGRGEGHTEPERARTSQSEPERAGASSPEQADPEPRPSRARAASEPRQSSPPQQDSALKIKFVMDLFA